jgi:hypothetical protein
MKFLKEFIKTKAKLNSITYNKMAVRYSIPLLQNAYSPYQEIRSFKAMLKIVPTYAKPHPRQLRCWAMSHFNILYYFNLLHKYDDVPTVFT